MTHVSFDVRRAHCSTGAHATPDAVRSYPAGNREGIGAPIDDKEEEPSTMAQEHKYRMNVYWSEPDQLWLVEVPDLPGAMADGVTPEEAVAHAQEVIENWIEVAELDGRPISEPRPYDALASA